MANEIQTTETVVKTEPSAPQNEETNAPVTEPKATIKIEGQSFDLDAALAQDDKTLRIVLQPHFASIENANITREVKDGKLTVTIVKKAQHKGYR